MEETHSSAHCESAHARRCWWASPAGQALIAAEAALVTEALEDVFGWECLQIGAWGAGRELLAACRTRHRAVLASPGLSADADIIGRPTQLPVSGDSIDAVLLPHTLEFASQRPAGEHELSMKSDSKKTELTFSASKKGEVTTIMKTLLKYILERKSQLPEMKWKYQTLEVYVEMAHMKELKKRGRKVRTSKEVKAAKRSPLKKIDN